MELARKLAILADAAKYDASCASSGTSKRHSADGRGLGSTDGSGICHSFIAIDYGIFGDKAAIKKSFSDYLQKLRERDRAKRTVAPARRIAGRKMTPDLARRILELHGTTEMTQQEIAFELGINQGRVNEVIKHRKWLNDDPSAPEAVASRWRFRAGREER